MQVGKGAQVDGAARVLLGAQVQHVLALDIGHHLGNIRQNGAIVAVPWRVLHLRAAHSQHLCYCARLQQSPCKARLRVQGPCAQKGEGTHLIDPDSAVALALPRDGGTQRLGVLAELLRRGLGA